MAVCSYRKTTQKIPALNHQYFIVSSFEKYGLDDTRGVSPNNAKILHIPGFGIRRDLSTLD